MVKSSEQLYSMIQAFIVTNNPVKDGVSKIIKARNEDISETDLLNEIHKSVKKRYSGLIKLLE